MPIASSIYLLLLLLSHFSCAQLCVTPETAAHQAPPSLRFSRQEHWSGLPFPSPMHEEKCIVKSLSHVRLFATPWTAAYQAPPSMGFSRQEYWSGVPSPSRELGPTLFQISCSISITMAKTGLSLCLHFFSTHHSSCGWNNCSKIQPLCFPRLKFLVDSHYLQ